MIQREMSEKIVEKNDLEAAGLGNVNISNEVIASIAGMAATQCYGLVGMSSRRFQDGIAGLLGKDNLSKGVEVVVENGTIKLRLFIVVEYGIRIVEVARTIMETVKFFVEDSTEMKVSQIDITVQGVRVGTAGKERND